MFTLTTIVGILLVVVLFYLYGIRKYDYWKKLGVPYIKPKYPFLGNQYKSQFGIHTTHISQYEFYNKYKDKKFMGIYTLTVPRLYVMDPALIHQILVKDFHIFSNRRVQIFDEQTYLFSATLIDLKYSKWRKLRQKLVPTFSKNKLKIMFDQINECTEKLIKFLDGKKSIKNVCTAEMNELNSRLVLDIITNCAFGLETDSINNPDSKFINIAKKVINPGTFAWKLRNIYPNLVKFFNLRINTVEVENFFKNLVKSNWDYREQNNIRRNDYFQILMDLWKKYEDDKKYNLKDGANDFKLDENLFLSNVFVFISAGYEGTRILLQYLFFELSRNQDIQEKLYNHIKTVLEKYNGEITFDAIYEMPYLDQVINETLRKYGAAETARVNCVDYKIPGTNVIIPKNTTILIPIFSLQTDEKYFPEPNKFQPERFSKENLKNIIKGTYIPFGDGPRKCIGASFTRLVGLIVTAKLLPKFKFTLNPKTDKKYLTSSLIFPTSQDRIWLNMQPREIEN